MINAAARALVDNPDERVFPISLGLAKRQPQAGVIDALGSCPRAEAIPCLQIPTKSPADSEMMSPGDPR
ncbi:MAG TPA: hypothetical protein VHJ16_11045 [Xanthobacteraceae bacterium]|nr:hypothetical protein [Xanthobacteraceae bacterium]